MTRPCQRRGAPRGFTLLELLLVLAVLVIVAAMAAPMLMGPLDNYRLRKAGDLVANELARARVAAMRDGATHIFQFQPETGNFRWYRWASEADGMNIAESTAPAASIGELPEGTRFLAVTVVADTRAYEIESRMSGAGGAADEAWSQPVLFHPDGATSTAEIVLGNKRELFTRVRLRGLTGVTRVSDLLSAEELAP